MIPHIPTPICLFAALSTLFLVIRLLFRTSVIYISKQWLNSLKDRFHTYSLYRIPQYNDHSQENLLFRKISTYIKSLPLLESSSDFVTLYSGEKPGDVLVALDYDQSIIDTFLHARVKWTYRRHESTQGGEFVLKVRSSDKKRILAPYIQHIYKVVDEIEQRNKELRVYLNGSSSSSDCANARWRSFPFIHPSSFDTIVLDNEVKNKVKSDLELFLKSRQYYNKIGRVWRRSYLLYGASGTGKSSFAAAMAKFLSYDLYDIDLSKPSDGSVLKTLLLQTTRKSLILIENLDLHLMGNSTSVSLSSVLNFMDGVVSSCGEERVMIFTMNCKYNIDPLVLRPGRIDVHIHFPFCDFNVFKALALSHLSVKDHKLFGEVEELFQSGYSRVSPAVISEIMISNRTNPSRALKSIVLTLQNDKEVNESKRVGRGLNGSSRERASDESDGSRSGSRSREVGVNALREIQKFYGLFRLKNSRKEEPLEMT